MTDIKQARVAILAMDGFEQPDQLVPLQTLRNPGDLLAFVAKTIEEIVEGRHARRSAA